MTEQATQTATPAASETPTPPPAANEYEALKAAVKAAEAGEESAETTPATSAPSATTEGGTPAVDAPATPAEDDGLPRIAKLLKAREKARETEVAAKSQADSIVAGAKAEAEKYIKEARAAFEKEMADQRAAYARSLRENPFKFITDHGMDRETLINDVAKEGSPEWQMIKRQEALIEDLKKEVKEGRSWREEFEKTQESSRQQARTNAIRETEKRFAALVSLDTAPNLAKLYSSDEIIAKGHTLARRLREETGEEATLEELRDYLEHEAKERMAKIQGAPSSPQTSATKQKAGTRTLTGGAQSERRAVPKSFSAAKTQEEQDALLMQAAEDAMKG